MSINTKLTLSCANKDCKKTHVIEGANATRAQLYKASKKDGWQWKNAEVQYCSIHKIVKVAKAKKPAKVADVNKPAKVATVAKAVAKRAPNAAPKKATPEVKPAPSWTPAPTSSGDGALA